MEDKMRLPDVYDLGVTSSSMSVAYLDLSVENQEGGYIKQNQIISLNTILHKWHLSSWAVLI